MEKNGKKALPKLLGRFSQSQWKFNFSLEGWIVHGFLRRNNSGVTRSDVWNLTVEQLGLDQMPQDPIGLIGDPSTLRGCHIPLQKFNPAENLT